MPRKTAASQAADNDLEKTVGAQDPQTDTDNEEAAQKAPGIQAGASENMASPQTGNENEPGEGTVGSQARTPGSAANSDDPLSQTGTEIAEDGVNPAAQGPLQPDTPSNPQTETEPEQNLAETNRSAVSRDETSPDSQTGSESASRDAKIPEEITKTPRRRSAKSQSGEETGISSQSDAAPRRRRARVDPVLAIDEQRSVETDADKLRNDLLDLVESQKGRKILSGAIQGVERSADNPNITFAVIYHGAFKVIIPAEETVRPPEDFRDRSPADVMHYLVTKRLGAEIDYIVKGVDVSSGIAAASRLEAMALKRRQYYFGSDRDGNNLIYEGLSAEARVVSVIRAGIFIDLFGLETYIALRELSYQRWIDAAAHFQPGQRVLVKILKLDRSDRDNIRVSASVKQAGENPYEQALKRYTPGSRYVGTVSMVDTNGVFVSLDGGIDCLCSYPKRSRPPRGARVTVRIIGVNHETNRIWGAITHMTTAR